MTSSTSRGAVAADVAPPAPPHPADPRLPAQRDTTTSADALVMGLLSERVPLSLLCDLGLPGGPASAEICSAEGVPAARWRRA